MSMSNLLPHRSLRHLASISLCFAPVLAVQAQTRYTVTELPVLQGAALCNATGLNDAGDVVGHCGPADENWNQTAVVWRQGRVVSMGKWSNGTYSQGTVINNVGGAGGHADTGNLRPQGWVARADGRWLNFFPNSSGNTYPLFLGDGGWIGGYYVKGSTGLWKGAIWKPSAKDPRKFTTLDLPVLPGAADPLSNQSLPLGFNNLGFAVGYGAHDRVDRGYALMWRNDAARTLEVLPDPADGSAQAAYAINGVGQIVGAGASADSIGYRPVVWNNDAARTAHFLPTLADENNGWAIAINDQGVVLGINNSYATSSTAARPERPVVWFGDAVFELSTLLDGGAYTLRSAAAINQQGQIAATGSSGGLVRALLLTPN